MEQMTALAFSKLLKVSSMTVRRYSKSGKIRPASLIKRGKRIMIIPDLAIQDFKKTIDPLLQRAIFPDIIEADSTPDAVFSPDELELMDCLNTIAARAYKLPPQQQNKILTHIDDVTVLFGLATQADLENID